MSELTPLIKEGRERLAHIKRQEREIAQQQRAARREALTKQRALARQRKQIEQALSALSEGDDSQPTEPARTARGRSRSIGQRKRATGANVLADRVRSMVSAGSTRRRDQLESMLREGPLLKTDIQARLGVSQRRVRELMDELRSSGVKIAETRDPENTRAKRFSIAA